MLLDAGKAELMSNGRGHINTISQAYTVPSVIRLMYMVKKPMMERKLSRRAVFYRDNFTCQYCGKQSKNLTLDHIVPRSRRGPHVWENVVSACIPCNHRKASSTPAEANMKLLREPGPPRPDLYSMFHHRNILEEWREFMPWVRQ